MDTLDGSSITAKVVSIVVAIVVFSMVLVPVVNGLADGNGSNGGGGSDSGEETVLATNTGKYYYDVVDNNSSVTYTFPDSSDPDSGSIIGNIAVNGTPILEHGMPEWTTDSSYNLRDSVPLLIFKTSDGKYGVEGICAGGVQDMDAEYMMQFSGIIYYRYILGVENSFKFREIVSDDISTPPTVTVSNGTVTYSGLIGSYFEPLTDGEYLLRLSDSKTSGDYCLIETSGDFDAPLVKSDTQMYAWANFGSVIVEFDEGTGEAVATRENAFTLFGAGTVDTIEANSESFNDKITGLTFDMNTSTVDNGLISLGSLDISNGTVGLYIVPVEITGISQGSTTLNNPEPYSLRYKYAEGTIPDFSIGIATDMQAHTITVTTENGTVTIDATNFTILPPSYVVLATDTSFITPFEAGVIYANEEGTMYVLLNGTIQCANGQLSLIPNGENSILDMSSMTPVSGNVALGTVERCYYADFNGEYGNYFNTQIGSGLYYDSSKPVYSYGLSDNGIVFNDFVIIGDEQISVGSVTSTITTSDNLYTGTTWTGGSLADGETVERYWTILPTSISNDNGGNGSGTGSNTGISGTAGTIIKTIPLFVGIALILAIVSMFYDPKNLIGGQQ